MMVATTMIGQQLQDWRAKENITQEEAAVRIGIARGHIAMIEEGRRNHLQAGTLLKLSRGLGVSVDTLLTLGEEDGVRTTGVATPGKATSTSS